MQIDGWNPKDIGYDTGYNHTYGVGTDTDAKSTGAVDGSKGECQTCKNRKYQDGSNENVSLNQLPTSHRRRRESVWQPMRQNMFPMLIPKQQKKWSGGICKRNTSYRRMPGVWKSICGRRRDQYHH